MIMIIFNLFQLDRFRIKIHEKLRDCKNTVIFSQPKNLIIRNPFLYNIQYYYSYSSDFFYKYS